MIKSFIIQAFIALLLVLASGLTPPANAAAIAPASQFLFKFLALYNRYTRRALLTSDLGLEFAREAYDRPEVALSPTPIADRSDSAPLSDAVTVPAPVTVTVARDDSGPRLDSRKFKLCDLVIITCLIH